MIFPLVLCGVVLLFVAWSRLKKAEAEIEILAARVRALETPSHPAAPETRPATTTVAAATTPAAPSTEAPASRPMPHAAPPSRPAAPSSAPAPRPAAIHTPPLTAAPSGASGVSLETRIGARWLLYVGIIAIVVGVSYFEKLAIDNGWIGETARIVQGAVIGLALVYAGRRFADAGQQRYGEVICGGGIAVLYLSTYAAFNLYALIPASAAFALMCAITALAAWLADRQRSEVLALIAVGGGFATPFLLTGATDAQLALFTYDAVLIAGTMYLAHRRQWPALNAVSYAFTVFTVSSWALRFYRPSSYLTTELFLTLYCAMYLNILRETWWRSGAWARAAAVLLSTAPPLYYVASIAILSTHSIALLIFLIAVAALGVMVAARAGSIVRLIFWIMAAVPLILWAQDHAGRAWLVGGLAATAAVYLINLAGHLEWTTRTAPTLAPADIALLHANGLWAFACAYVLLETTALAATPPLAAALALLHGGLAVRIAPRHREHALHFAALGFTLLMVAIALQFNGPWVTAGWAVEGAVIVALGLREQRDWLRVAGVLLFMLAICGLLQLEFAPPPPDQVVFLNRRCACGLVVVALTYWMAWIHRRAPAGAHGSDVAVAMVAAQLLTLALLTSEIVGYWEIHAADARSFVARGLMLSLTWALYATALIVAGIRKDYAPVRYVAIGVFAVTIVKVFVFDLATLDRIYRVSSIIGLGVLLLVTSYLYQRFRVSSPAENAQ